MLTLAFTQTLAGTTWIRQARGEESPVSSIPKSKPAGSTPTASKASASKAAASKAAAPKAVVPDSNVEPTETPAAASPAEQSLAGQTPAGQTPAGQTPAAKLPVVQGDSAPDERASVTELAARAAELYHARRYTDAIDVYERAFAIDADPNLVFNVARCYEKLGDVAAAIRRYEEYIALPGAETEGRLRAQVALDDLRRLQAGARERRSQVTPTAAPKVDPPSREVQTSVARLDGRLEASAKPLSPAPLDYSEPASAWPWVAFSSGILGVGAGVLLYVSGHGEHQTLTKADNYTRMGGVYEFTQADAVRRRARGDEMKFWGVAAAGAGGALLVTSLVLFLVNANEEQHDRGRSVAFDVGPTVGGATFNFTGSL